MATVKKRISSSGAVSYHIRCYDGYDASGRQIEKAMTWKPDPTLPQKAVEKELQRQVILFETNVKRGFVFDGSTRFSEYAERWLDNNKPPQLSAKTYARYKDLLAEINKGIGHIRLEKLQSNHLLGLYNNLREEGMNKRDTYATAINLSELLSERSISQASFARLSGLSQTTVSAAIKNGGRIAVSSAEKMAKALGQPVNKIFTITCKNGYLSETTILHYHRLISTILSQATRDRLIPYNIADRDYIKAPRKLRKEARFLEDFEIQEVISLLENEPIKWRTAIMLLTYSGMRRSELMGLQWNDIDYENEVIHILRASEYERSVGIITKDTKTSSSCRTIKLPAEAFTLLRDYRIWWDNMQTAMGSKWHYKIEITHSDGKKELVNNDRLFIKDDSTPMHPDSLTDWTDKFVKRNNLPKFSPHSIRHTNASLLISNGVSIPTVSKRLGHSNPAVTAKIYSHAIQSADAIASDIISDKLNPVKRTNKL